MILPQIPFCSNCGAQLAADSRFCEACGAPVKAALPPQAIVAPAQPVAPPPAAAPQRRKSFSLLLSLAGLLVSCGMLVGGGIGLLNSAGGLNGLSQYLPVVRGAQSPTAASAASATVPLLPTAAAVSSPQPPSIPSATPDSQNGFPFNIARLPEIILSPANLPPGWTSKLGDYSGLSNEQLANSFENSAEILTNFNKWGRLANSTHYYDVPDDPCKADSGPRHITLNVTVLKLPTGAVEFYGWASSNTDLANQAGIGERSNYSFAKHDETPRICNANFARHYLNSQRANVVVRLIMDVMEGAMTDTAAEKQIKAYGQVLDALIIANSN